MSLCGGWLCVCVCVCVYVKGKRCAQFRKLGVLFLLSTRAVWTQIHCIANVSCLKICGFEGESTYLLYQVVRPENSINL